MNEKQPGTTESRPKNDDYEAEGKLYEKLKKVEASKFFTCQVDGADFGYADILFNVDGEIRKEGDYYIVRCQKFEADISAQEVGCFLSGGNINKDAKYKIMFPIVELAFYKNICAMFNSFVQIGENLGPKEEHKDWAAAPTMFGSVFTNPNKAPNLTAQKFIRVLNKNLGESREG
ncbi:MAG: hypothetical protein WCT18_00175 [Patescibacteria group bacterium]